MKKNMLIISYSNLEKDPRVYRQIETFKESYNITTVGYSPSKLSEVTHYTSHFTEFNKYTRLKFKLLRQVLLRVKKHEELYWIDPVIKDTYEKIKKENFDIIIANDINTLPLALKIKGQAKVLFDAHEYFPRQHEQLLKWRKYYQPYFTYLCSTYMPKADSIVTVSEGIAKEYAEQFSLDMPKVITNATEYQELKPTPINEEKITIIHHGVAVETREIEKMIMMMDFVEDRFRLDLMLVNSGTEYYKKLVKMAETRKNVSIIEPVDMKEIAKTINNYDVGLYILTPSSFNYKKALPNKFFEYIQGRLMILIGPSEEMANLLDEYKLGVVARDFDPKSLASELNNIQIEDVIKYKNNSNIAARELNADNNMNMLKEIVNSLIESDVRE